MGIFNKIPFYKRSMEFSGKGLLHFYQEASSLTMSNQNNHRTNMFCLINPTLAKSQTKSAFVL